MIAVFVALAGIAGLTVAWFRCLAMLKAERAEHASFAKRFSAIIDLEAEAEVVQQRLRAQTEEIKGEIERAEKHHLTERKRHQSIVAEERQKRTELTNQYRKARHKYTRLEEEIALLEENLEDVSFGLYRPHFTFDTSEDYKVALKSCRDRQRQLIRKGGAVRTPGNWTVEGSRAAGKRMERQYTKVMLRAFNGECDSAVAKVRWNNATKMVRRVEKSYADINKLGEVMKMSISTTYLKEKLTEIRLTHEYQDKRNEEKEQEREHRTQMREQARSERELAKAEAEAAREEERQLAALAKARSEADAATGEQLKRLIKQIASLEHKVGEAHGRRERVKARAQLTRSGFVYVLSNKGSFGDDVVKIGMTRRMEPMDRVKELSDASVPFPFDMHVMMFSEDAPALERSLHEHFEDRRVNLVNYRKEYFCNVSLGEVESFIRAKGVTAQFTLIPEAREYRETQAALVAKNGSEPDAQHAMPEADELFADKT